MEKEEVDKAYKQVFESDNGKIVLRDLISFCGMFRTSVYEVQPNTEQTMFAEGKRRVFLRITSKLCDSEYEMYEKFAKKGNEDGSRKHGRISKCRWWVCRWLDKWFGYRGK